MAKLIYSTISSFDGYINDAQGDFDWAAPDEEVLAFLNEQERPIGTYLYGRRLYELMAYWETATDVTGASADFMQIWRAADKVVYSTTLESVSTNRTRLERNFDPAEIRRMKAESEKDISIGGPTLAAVAIRAGLVDELRFFLHPTVIGGGTATLAPGISAKLELVDEQRFACGVVYLGYRCDV
jgi:dihydrofolate reductase